MRSDQIKILCDFRLSKDYFLVEKEFKMLTFEEKMAILINHKPEVFQIETTTKCNLNCPLCSTHHLKRGYVELDEILLDKIIKANPQMRYVTLHLMGEPLLSKNIFKFIMRLKEKKVFTFFSTNGTLLKQKTEKILTSGLDKISISLDAITQEDMRLYRRSGQLNDIVEGIKALLFERGKRRLNRPIVQIQTIMFRYNEEKEDQLYRFLMDLGADRVKFKTVSFESFGAKNKEDSGIPLERLLPKKYTRRDPNKVMYRDRAVCRMLFQGFVLADGSVVPCCIDYDGSYSFGNLTYHNWDEIWYSSRRHDVLREYFEKGLSICQDCSMSYDYSWEISTS